jgi:apolipoprotein N-acyltransferase
MKTPPMLKRNAIGIWVFFIGMFTTFADAPFALWPVGLATLAFLYGLVRRASGPRQAFGAGLVWALGWQVAALYWLPRAFYLDADRSVAAAVFGGIPALLGLALYGALGIGLVCALARWTPARVRAPAFVAAWLALEVAKSLSPYGFPWLPLGAMFAPDPWLAQLASLGGVYLLSLLALAVAVLASRLSPARWLAALALLGLSAGFGAWRLHQAPAVGQGATALIRVVQPNIQTPSRWDPHLRYQYLLAALQVAFPPGITSKPALVVMPESAVAFFLDEETPIRGLVASHLAPGQVMLTGTVREEVPPTARDPRDNRYFNSLMAVGADGKILDLYDKHLLVPFGEQIPFHSLLNRLPLPFDLRTVSQSRLDYTPGTAAPLLMTPAGPALGLICYEGIFPLYVAQWAAHANFLVNVTNDNWFTGTIALAQHANLARLRAIETGRPLVRVANTGITLVADGYGRTVATLPVNTIAVADVPLPPALPATPFLRLVTALAGR